MACKNSKTVCTCTAACDKHGNCCECVAYHRAQDQVPGCFFSEAGERTFDRSIPNLYNDYMSRR